MRWDDRPAAWRALPDWARKLYRAARKNAEAREIPFRLTLEEYAAVVLASGDQCAVSGLRFLHERRGSERRAFAPSLDRIKADTGYESGNVRLVCVAVNFAMNVWGESVLMEIAAAISRKRPSDRTFQRAAGYKLLPGVDAYVTRRKGVRYRAKMVVAGKRVRIPGVFTSEHEAHTRYLEHKAELANSVPIVASAEGVEC